MPYIEMKKTVITNAMRNLCQTEMSNRYNSHASYLLFTIFNFTLNIAIIVLNYALYIIKVVIEHVFDVKMTEKVKKRKRDPNQTSNQTVPKRGAIDANWQKLLSSSLMEEKKEKVEEKTNYTGTFRRARKKNKELTNNVNIKSLNISNDKESESSKKENVEKERKQNKLTKFIAMDCEMVGVGYDGNDHMLARVSIVNKFGDCIYDKFVKAREEVVDYRTEISGIRKEDMLKGEDFNVVQKEVSEIIKGRILVGHSLKNDLSVLFLSHPKRNIRDTSRYKPFRKITKGSTPSLKRLAKEILNIDIQHGEHSSVEDAKAAMQLYCTVSKNWEQILSEKKGYSRKFVES